MIKIEVRIRRSIDGASVEHEYRAELPDGATAEQIAAVGAEAMEAVPSQVSEQQSEEVPTIHFGNRGA